MAIDREEFPGGKNADLPAVSSVWAGRNRSAPTNLFSNRRGSGCCSNYTNQSSTHHSSQERDNPRAQ
jgi:hypothetical protein